MKGHCPKLVLVIFGIGVVLPLLLWPWLRCREPVYQRKTVSAWFDGLQKRQVSWQQFQLAIDEIGHNHSCPFLVARIRREDSSFRRFHRTVWPILPVVFQRRWPMPRPLDDGVYRTVGLALRSSDPTLVSKLVRALSDRNRHVRFTALTALKPVIDKIKIETLAKLLGDPDAEIRELAARTLSGMGTQSRQAMPQLITALSDGDARVRFTVAGQLGGFGPEAKVAVPALQVLLKDTDWEVRRNAAAALWDIDRDTNAITTLIGNAENAIQLGSAATGGTHEVMAVVNMLNELGASVKSAAPTILQTLVVDGEQTPIQDEFHRRVREILARIDPEVANKSPTPKSR